MRKAKLAMASIAVTALLSQNFVGVIDAAGSTTVKPSTTKNTTQIKTLNNLKSVKITSKSVVKLSNVNILSQDDGSLLTYTLTYQNNDKKALSLVDYWTNVKTKSGTVYSVTVIASDKEKKKVVPGATTSITYTTKIAKGIKVSDLSFQIIKWNFGVAGYEEKLGTINIPSDYKVATPLKTAQKISVNNLSAKLKVDSVSVIGLGENNYVQTTLQIENVGSKTIENPNMKYVVQTSSGTAFASAEAAGSNYQIFPQESKKINLVTKIPKAVNLNNLQLVVVQSDETTKTDLPIASLELGTKKGQNSVIGINKEKVLAVDNNNIVTRIDSVLRNQNLGKSNLSIQFVVANKGDESVVLPNYAFEIQSGTKSYPLVASGVEGLALEPGEEQLISLDGTIPIVTNADQLELILKTSTGTTSNPQDPNTKPSSVSSYPLVAYKLPEYTEMQHAMGKERIIKNNDGTFGVTLDTIQKLPWNDGNLLVTKITIANKGTKAAKLPELTGAYKMDMTSLNSAVQLINSNNTQIIAAGEQSSVYVVGNVPSNLKFSMVQVQLLQKVGAEKTNNWIMFSNYGETSELKLVKDGSYLDLNTAGKKADLQTRKTYLYKGSTNDIIYTELIMKNREKQQMNPSQLAGYFLTDKGQYYKAEVSQTQNTVGPDSTSIVSLSAKVPKGVTVSNWNLVVGESITDNKLTEPEGKATGYVNASAMELKLDSRSIQTNLNNVELFPYSLTVKELKGKTSSSGLEIKFKYDLNRDLAFDMGKFNHKFVLEVTDSSGTRFEKEIEIEKDFVVGTNQSFSYVVNDLIFATSRTGSFQFSIYDSYQGEKVKIATQAAAYDNGSLYD
ncbi:hypothetical protein FHR92_002226 [Fontibacillus solani]|uniref:DUF4352 domain-containing protein n=1 Tax=Fontibacillus solani TaxID=1572857 RepID=A0A7W3XRP7_9BACL|nr:hypothetical protein [Fontibacillus solani]MBA9085759.1 hypothetical protein [Fontibacillus solani]